MKKTFLILFLFIGLTLTAQVETPQPSPKASIEQMVGLTNISIDYSRPSLKGREIFGELIPYGKKWRTGANQNTVVSFKDDVTVEGKALKAGSYALYTIPGKETWEIIFYSNTKNWGLPSKWDKSKEALRVSVRAEEIDYSMETFTLLFDNLRNDSAVLRIMWQNTMVPIAITTPSMEKAVKSIETTLSGKPTAADYYAAGSYYAAENKELEKALGWVDKSISMSDNPGHWMLRQKALIQAQLGKKKEAMQTLKKSLQLAEKNEDAHYIKLNKETLKEWGVQ
ncbi:DUF2911 domain-containing protein [Haloflavibacter putidus]|uniref:DUF2911 domain-containing protein n=1 Tax=Haloflavibacter putidus TaxID=2576776 RepID=A0A507ZSX8_9FLAO|nr:DUF2911 domain-containing protein [Haloflavibacter putidus]TQD40077.1 DUF2911 domain-containing protein [Haloflavibacter putidus]